MSISPRSFTSVIETHAQTLHMQKARELQSEKQAIHEDYPLDTETAPQEDDSPAAMLERFTESLDEMSAFVSLFRSRRELDKKNAASAESVLERVLEEDIEPKISQLLKAVEGGKGTNIQTLLQQLRSLFPDDSDLVLVLREMLYKRDLDEVVKKRLAKLLELVEKQADPRTLKAGINVALKARLFGKHLNFSPALLRNTYRDFLVTDYHEVDIYQSWIEQYGPTFRHAVIEFMEGALLTDMSASDPSCSQIEFGNFLGKLGAIKNIRSGDVLFMKNLSENSIVEKINVTENDWLHFLFCVLKNVFFLREHLLAVLGDKVKYLSAKQFSVLLNIIYLAFKKLPRNIFYTEEEADELENRFKGLATETRKIALTENNNF